MYMKSNNKHGQPQIDNAKWPPVKLSSLLCKQINPIVFISLSLDTFFGLLHSTFQIRSIELGMCFLFNYLFSKCWWFLYLLLLFQPRFIIPVKILRQLERVFRSRLQAKDRRMINCFRNLWIVCESLLWSCE